MPSCQSDNPKPPLSAVSRFSFLILLLLLLAFSGCSPIAHESASTGEDLLPQELAPEQIVEVQEELTEPEPEITASLEVEELKSLGDWEEGTPQPQPVDKKVEYDFPVTMNRQVEFYLDFFQNKQRQTFSRWLERSGRYLPMIKKQLREAGLPTDLAYLPMIESGYSLTAFSKARAVGPWQFIRGTGSSYGLTIDEYVDERRDPEKATQAAIAYLSSLYAEFDSWHLAVAGYNAGEGRIRKAVKRYKTKNFWEIASTNYLMLETKRYVPKLIAAIIIAKDPEKYGFTGIEYQTPLDYETIDVPRWTSLRAVALAGDVPFEELRELNRQLRKAITPPDQDPYLLKVPVGKKEVIAKKLPDVRAIVSTEYKTHIVATGDTLTRICKRYNLNKTTLLKANNLRFEQLTIGQHLRIPYQTTTYKVIPQSQLAGKTGAAGGNNNLVLHKIQPGETLYELSIRYGVPIQMIASWNDLKDLHRIKAGQQLALYLQDGAKPVEPRYASKVPAAKTSVPSTSGAGPKDLQADLDSNPSDSIGKTIRAYYKVRGGDTLWSIARRYKTSTREIKKLNQLDSDLIYPGLKLLLEFAADLDT